MKGYYLSMLADGSRVITTFDGAIVAKVLAYKHWLTSGFNRSKVENEHVIFKVDGVFWHGRTRGDNQVCRCNLYKDQRFARRALGL